MSRTKSGLKNGFYYEKTGFYSIKKLIFILNTGLMSKTDFYSEKLVFILKKWFLLFSSFLLKLKIYYLWNFNA